MRARLTFHEHTLGQLRLIAKGMGLKCEQYLKRHEIEDMIRARYEQMEREDEKDRAA